MIDLRLGDVKEPLPQRILDKFCKRAFENVNLYPQNYDGLVSKLAEKHGLEADNIVLVNGVDEGIELIARVFGQDSLVFTPTYYEFVDAPKRNNLKYKTINCFDGKEYALKYTSEDVRDKTLIFLCNPNNPFGLLSSQEIVALAKQTKGVVAVDETYIGFAGETVLGKAPNILVLRSFSKAFSLAGLRIAYVAGSKTLVDKIKQRKLFFNVSSVSVNAAKIVLEEEKHFKVQTEKIKKRKESVETFLKTKGLNTIHSHTNNTIIKFDNEQKASNFHKTLKENNILANQGNGISTTGLNPTFIRLTCGTEGQMKEVRGVVEREM